MISRNLEKNDAADVTADTSVATNYLRPPITPLDSALKDGLDSMLLCCLVVISS